MQTDGGIDPDSMAWMGGSLGASSGDTEDLSPKYRQSGEKKRRGKRRGSQSFRSGREDDWGSSSGPSSSNKPSKGTKRAKREGEAEGDEGEMRSDKNIGVYWVNFVFVHILCLLILPYGSLYRRRFLVSIRRTSIQFVGGVDKGAGGRVGKDERRNITKVVGMWPESMSALNSMWC